MTRRRFLLEASASAGAIALTACGGGGDGAPTSVVLPDVPPSPVPPPPPPPAVPPHGNDLTLGDAASRLSPGQWGRLHTAGGVAGLSGDLFDAYPGTVLGYIDKGKWDSFLRRVFFIGQGHYSNLKFIQYDEASNRWSVLPKPPWDGSPAELVGHGYQHNSINPANGDLYWRKFNSLKFYRLDRASGQWTQLPEPVISQVGIAGGVEYFPEMGGVVFAARKTVATFVNGRWTTLYNGTLPMAEYHNVAIYSKPHQVVYLGGGNDSRELYKMSPGQVITRLPDPPVAPAVATTVTTADPVSGNLLLFADAGAAYQFVPGANAWSRLVLNVSPIRTVEDTVAIPIDTYGVIMFVRGNRGNPEVWLYRHAPEAAVPVS